MALALYACDNCGQVDDHPKVHYGDETYHHDCLPARVLEDMTSVSQYGQDEDGNRVLLSRTPVAEENLPEHTKRALKAREMAQKGTRGEKLRKHLVSLPPLESPVLDQEA